MKTYEEFNVELHAFLISALGGGEWSASRPVHFNSCGKIPQYLFCRRLVGPHKTGLDEVTIKNPCPCWKSHPLSLYWLSYPGSLSGKGTYSHPSELEVTPRQWQVTFIFVYGREKKRTQNFGCKTWTEETTWKDDV